MLHVICGVLLVFLKTSNALAKMKTIAQSAPLEKLELFVFLHNVTLHIKVLVSVV